MLSPTVTKAGAPHQARAGAFYFAYMAAQGAVGAFLYLLYRQHGLNPGEIGLVIAVSHLANFFVLPTWGAASDLMESRRGPSLLAIACLGAGPTILLVQAAQGLAATLAAVLIWGFFAGAIVSLADAATVRMLGYDRPTYGRVRVWGSIGAVLSSLIVGQLGNRLGLDIVFPTYAAMMFVCAALAFSFPRASYVAKQVLSGNPARLLGSPAVLLFLAAVLFLSIAYLIWRSTFSLFLDDLGGSPGQIGVFFALSSLVEIPVQASSGRWLRRFGARRSLIAAFAVLATLWLLCSLVGGPQMALALAVLHGLSFGAYQVAGVVYVSEVTPPEHAGLAQGAYGSVGRGLGSIVGSISGGYLFQSAGGRTAYRVSALLGLASLAFLLLLPGSRRQISGRAGTGEDRRGMK